MNEIPDDAGIELMREAQATTKRIDAIHQRLRAFQDRLRQVEDMAERAGLQHVKLALRDAFTASSRSGQSLVDAHVAMNVPTSAWGVRGRSTG